MELVKEIRKKKEAELDIISNKLKILDLINEQIRNGANGYDILYFSKAPSFPNLIIENINLKSIGERKINEAKTKEAKLLMIRLEEAKISYQKRRTKLKNEIQTIISQ